MKAFLIFAPLQFVFLANLLFGASESDKIIAIQAAQISELSKKLVTLQAEFEKIKRIVDPKVGINNPISFKYGSADVLVNPGPANVRFVSFTGIGGNNSIKTYRDIITEGTKQKVFCLAAFNNQGKAFACDSTELTHPDSSTITYFGLALEDFGK